MILTARHVHEGERIPWGYGVAYLRCNAAMVVCYPVPFNLLVRWLRTLYFAVAFPPPSLRDRLDASEARCRAMQDLIAALQKQYVESVSKYWTDEDAKTKEQT